MLTILTSLFLLLACGPAALAPQPDESMPQPPKEPLAYLALGDSYTIGESVPESERWPVQLADSLRVIGCEVEQPRIVARTGWTTDELKAGIARASLPDTFDLVSLLIGVNNQYRGRSLSEYQVQFEELLMMAVSFAGGDTSKVFVLSIPDYGVTPFARNRDPERISREIDTFNTAAREICERYRIPFHDITPISREAQNDLSLLASDQLHPSGKMYSRWVSHVLTDVEAMLGK